MCGGDGAFLHTVITGFSRVGVEGSGPFYQLRGSFGKGWGINGLIRLKKENDSLSRYGHCNLHLYIFNLVAKKY